MEEVLKFTKKHWILVVFIIIILGAFFLRTYNLSEWLYFKSDQVRDAKLAATAFENGPGELPLLGPRAAGTFLRLGPIFYYEEYSAATIFNSIEPHIFVFPDLLFSLLTIPLLFFFLRTFFSERISMLTTILYAFSFIIVQYSRFAWNPNQIPFWSLIFLLSLLKIYYEKNDEKAGWWLVLAGFSYGVVSQLHFIAFVGSPIVAVLFWIPYFPKKINWKHWVGAVVAGMFVYIPVVLSDIFTQGDNLKQFIFALTAKTGDQALGLIGNLKVIAISFFMFLTSFGHKEGVISLYLGIILIVLGVGALVYLWKKDKKNRPFVYLILIWFIVFVVLQIKSNISLKPRFFMPIAVIPFILWGVILKVIESFKCKAFIVIAYFSFVVILLMNFSGIRMWFDYLDTQDISKVTRKIFIKQDDGKTLGQIRKAADFMATNGRDLDNMVCFSSGPDYERSYEYVFDVYYPDISYDRISKSIENKEECVYFSIASAKDGSKIISNKYVDYFDIGDAHNFGTIAVWEIYPKEEFLNYNQIEDESRGGYEEESKEELINNEESEEEINDKLSSDETTIEKEEKKEKPPKRLERVFWKHVFGANYEE